MTTITTFKQWFDPLFLGYLRNKLTEMCLVSGNYSEIKDPSQHVLFLARGGKRVRPFVAYLAALSTGFTSLEELLPLLFGLELFHLFALIHDDIIDDSSLRRDIQSFHARYSKAQALLWGDLCFSLANEAITTAPFPEETRILFSRVTQETIVGQMLDSIEPREDLFDTVIELKTARYTFVYPTLLGFSVAGVVIVDPLYYRLGTLLGRAFQRLDDLVDEPEEAGIFLKQKELVLRELHEAEQIIGLLKIKKEHQKLWCSLVDLMLEKLTTI